MSWDRKAYSEVQWEEVNNGKLCPNSECKSTDIETVGANPDGMNMNIGYDCNTCGQEWEGY